MFGIIKTHHIFSFEEIWYLYWNSAAAAHATSEASLLVRLQLCLSRLTQTQWLLASVSNKTTLNKVLLISPASRKVATRTWRGLCVSFSRWPPIKRFSWNWLKKKKKKPFVNFLPSFYAWLSQLDERDGKPLKVLSTQRSLSNAAGCGCSAICWMRWGGKCWQVGSWPARFFFFFFFYSTSLGGAVLTPLKRIQPEWSLCFLCLHFLTLQTSNCMCILTAVSGIQESN